MAAVAIVGHRVRVGQERDLGDPGIVVLGGGQGDLVAAAFERAGGAVPVLDRQPQPDAAHADGVAERRRRQVDCATTREPLRCSRERQPVTFGQRAGRPVGAIEAQSAGTAGDENMRPRPAQRDRLARRQGGDVGVERDRFAIHRMIERHLGQRQFVVTQMHRQRAHRVLEFTRQAPPGQAPVEPQPGGLPGQQVLGAAGAIGVGNAVQGLRPWHRQQGPGAGGDRVVRRAQVDAVGVAHQRRPPASAGDDASGQRPVHLGDDVLVGALGTDQRRIGQRRGVAGDRQQARVRHRRRTQRGRQRRRNLGQQGTCRRLADRRAAGPGNAVGGAEADDLGHLFRRRWGQRRRQGAGDGDAGAHQRGDVAAGGGLHRRRAGRDGMRAHRVGAVGQRLHGGLGIEHRGAVDHARAGLLGDAGDIRAEAGEDVAGRAHQVLLQAHQRGAELAAGREQRAGPLLHRADRTGEVQQIGELVAGKLGADRRLQLVDHLPHDRGRRLAVGLRRFDRAVEPGRYLGQRLTGGVDIAHLRAEPARRVVVRIFRLESHRADGGGDRRHRLVPDRLQVRQQGLGHALAPALFEFVEHRDGDCQRIGEASLGQ